jgi:class 3 adenylate cyclase/tetratricopeptide (TPR) repeat protein
VTCPQCGHENPINQKFCGDCGAGLAAVCRGCGTTNPPGQRFCGECGRLLNASAPRLAPSHGADAPGSYTPRHLAERILTSRTALEGERKQVTVLFADLKGSMELLADRDPEEARGMLDPVLEHMMEAVHRYEGTVNQVLGDGIMALFGAPLAHEDHAVRACYAALRMQERIGRHGDELQRSGGIPLQIRVGLNSGEVVVRAIGSDLRMDYTAVGQTTHLAARMEQIAKPGSVLLTAETHRLAEGFVATRALGAVPVKGLDSPVEAFELTGVGSVRSRFQAAATRGLTRLVGRDAELEALAIGLARTRDGHGQAIAVVGEPGVGKSRLFWEFINAPRLPSSRAGSLGVRILEGWLVLEASSVSYGKATPYLPVIGLLRTYFQLSDRDDVRAIGEKVTGKVLTLDRALEPCLPALLTLLDAPPDDPAWQVLEPSQRRQQTLDAVRRLLVRESRIQPLLLVFEDLHWIDGETQAVVDGLVESLPTARILLLVNYRPEYSHGWGRKTYYVQLRLDPLPREDASVLLSALLGDDATLELVKALLVERTEGNPFFLEESVRTLVETGALTGERGRYRSTGALRGIQIPATVQAVLATRIDRLPPEDKRLLQSAAVIGKDVPLALLQAISEVGEEPLRAGLTRLQATEFLYEAALFPDLEYTFKHALTLEVAYASLLQGQRRALHARIVGAVEVMWSDRLAEQVERLAGHAFRGELWNKALAYGREAGGKAARRSAYREALGALERAREALSHLPEGPETLEHGIDLRLDFLDVLNALGDLPRMLDLLAEAERLAEALNDRPRLARVLSYANRCFWWLGEHEPALAAGERALEIARTLADTSLEAAANYHLGLSCMFAGDYRRGVNLYRRSSEILRGRLESERLGMPALPGVISRTWLGYGLACLGDFVGGTAMATEAVRVAEAAGHPYSIAVAIQGVGFTYVVQGDLPRALHWLERAIDIVRAGGFAVLRVLSETFLGRALSLAGRHSEALAMLEDGGAYAESIQLKAVHALNLAWLADANRRAGRIADAMAMIERAMHATRTHRQRAAEAEVFLTLAASHACGESPDLKSSLAATRQALSLADDLGSRPLVARGHLMLGYLSRRAGSSAQAGEHLALAVTMFADMGMAYWLEQATSERPLPG